MTERSIMGISQDCGGVVMARRKFLISSLAAATAPLIAAPAVTQAAGADSLKVVVPFAAGGGVDVFARLISEKLRQIIGLTVIVENRPGASGSIGGKLVQDAAPDGSMLLFSAGTHVMVREVMRSAPYDPIEDFASIARVGEAPMLLVVAPNVTPENVRKLIDEVRKAPEKWTMGASALGAPGHLAELEFNHLSGLKIVIQPYRGTAPALNDVAGGHIQMLIDPVLALLPMVQAGKVKGLAVTTAKRTPLAPDIPTMAESGLVGMDHSSWYGFWGPKRMPATQVEQLNSAINRAVQELDREGKLSALGISAVTETPEQFKAFATNYRKRNAELLEASNFTPL